MTDWKKMDKEDENVRFCAYTYFETIFSFCVVEATKDEDKDNDFLGKIDLGSQEALLRVARDGWGILPEEIKFLEG